MGRKGNAERSGSAYDGVKYNFAGVSILLILTYFPVAAIVPFDARRVATDWSEI